MLFNNIVALTKREQPNEMGLGCGRLRDTRCEQSHLSNAASPRYLDNGNQWFSMLVGTGTGDSGVEIQELHFTAYPTWSQSGSVFTWSGDVICRQLKSADDEYDDIIIELPPPWDSWLDIVVTGYPDGRDPETLPRLP